MVVKIIGEDNLDHVLLWLLCDMSAQQADSESLLQKKFPTFQIEKHIFWQFFTSELEGSEIALILAQQGWLAFSLLAPEEHCLVLRIAVAKGHT